MKEKLGFIGLGGMGSRMATRLVKAGYPLTVFNRSPDKTKQLVDAGAAKAESVTDLVSKSQVILMSLSDDAAVEQVMDEALSTSPAGKIFIDLSTVLPDTSRRIAKTVESRSASFLDTPVSGSTPQAQNGELLIMVGGDQTVAQQMRPVLEPLARKIAYMGPSGNGASSKLAVNALLGIGVQAVAEALMLGTRLGLDKSRLIDLISDTVVVSPSQKTKLQNARTGEYAPAFPLRLMNKDLGLIMAAASATSTPMPVVAIAHQISKTGVARGRGDEDMSVVIKIMEELLNP